MPVLPSWLAYTAHGPLCCPVPHPSRRWTLADADAAGAGAAAGAAAASAAAAAPADAGVFEVLPAQDWFALTAYYGPGSEGGGGKKRRRQAQRYGEQLEALLERYVFLYRPRQLVPLGQPAPVPGVGPGRCAGLCGGGLEPPVGPPPAARLG